jgi:uncharacterized protein involved in type VI secretion and phage assembly
MENLTAEDLASELLSEDSVNVVAESPGPVWQRLIQWRQTDFDLLESACERSGIYFWVRDDELRLITMEGDGDPVDLTLGRNLFQISVEANCDSACKSVVATAWDPSRMQLRHGEATSARVESTASIDVDVEDVGGKGELTLVDRMLVRDDQAEALAQAELDRRTARRITLSGIADGAVELVPGTRVKIGGVATEMEGIQVLSGVVHCVNAEGGGYTCEITAAPPPARKRAAGVQVVWGVVSQVDDPDGLGRVRVKLPAYNDVETDWLVVASAGAGVGKGMIWLPDCKDHVLVLFSDLEIAQGLIIGGLFGPEGAPDKGGVESGKVRGYSLITPGGQRLRLDDTHKSVRLENKNGSFVEMTPGHVHLLAAADLTLEAPGKKISICANAIEFQQK